MNIRTRPLLVLAAAAALHAAPAHALCPETPTVRAFEAWGDNADYAAIPGGSFNGSIDWSTTGPASLVSDPHPYTHDEGDATSVQLGRDATITSPPICVTRWHPHLRFVARSIDRKSHLAVEAIFLDDKGKLQRRALGDNAGNRYAWWSLVKQVSLRPALPREGFSRMIQLRFVARGGSDGWLVDSVFVDPVKRG